MPVINMNMKIIVFCFVAVMISAQSVYAAGLLWRTEYAAVEEGSTKCITYGVYNPFETDMKAAFSLDGEVKNIADFKFDETVIKARTYHDSALPVEVCFTAHKIYKEDCLLGPLLCEKKCSEQRVTFEGDVVVTDAPLSSGGITGSKAVVSASAPLKVEVLCVPQAMNYMPLFAIAIAIIIAVFASMLFRKYRTPALVRKQRKLEKLQTEIEKAKRKK